MIDSITLAGAALDLDDVEYSVSIQHGRSDVTTSPAASNCQIVIRGPVGVAAEIADTIEITAYTERRFTGEVSDIRIQHLSTEPPTAVTTITGIGNLARVSYVQVGISGFSEQTVFQRVDDVLAATGLTYLNGADPDLVLASIGGSDTQATDALSYLAKVAEWTGGTYFDDPFGRVVFESYGNRGITTFAGIWSTQFGTWAQQGGTWADIPVDRSTIDLPPGEVIWAPSWSRTRSTIINDVTVISHNANHTANQTDSASISSYGLKEYRLETEIKTSGDVTARAGKIITAQANPLWSIGEISILVHLLEPGERDPILKLVSGASVVLRNLPQPAPVGQFVGIVEGWGESYTNEQHILTLSISDPRYSFETITWGEVPNTLDWSDLDPALQWFELVTAGDLT